MNITYDKQADAAYFALIPKRKVAWTEERAEWLLTDHDKNGKVLGIEVLFASHYLTTLFKEKFLKPSRAHRKELQRKTIRV